MTFVDAIRNQSARTENGMKARNCTGDSSVSFFYAVGGMRGKNIIPHFVAALAENKDYALRIALWARDIRGGAGERKIYHDILNYLVLNDPDTAILLIKKTPEIGRWKDIIPFVDSPIGDFVISQIRSGLEENNGLLGKWLPRKGELAARIRNGLGMSPKQYRKTIVGLTSVVETQMCAKDWDSINFNHVPSVASSRYKNAFNKNAPAKYSEWVGQLVKQIQNPEIEKTAKVNAAAIYPHDVLGELIQSLVERYVYNRKEFSTDVLNHILAQWEALPNYVEDKNVLVMVDSSSSMWGEPIRVAISLGLYFADKNKGKFKDCFLNFDSNSSLHYLKGNILQKIAQMGGAPWGGSTNLHSAFDSILKVAVEGNVPPEEMPEVLMIVSDMQANGCLQYDDSAIEMIRRKYSDAGYKVPNIVFWNVRHAGNVPVKCDERGVAMISGFSPAISKTVLENLTDLNPLSIMEKTIMIERYDLE